MFDNLLFSYRKAHTCNNASSDYPLESRETPESNYTELTQTNQGPVGELNRDMVLEITVQDAPTETYMALVNEHKDDTYECLNNDERYTQDPDIKGMVSGIAGHDALVKEHIDDDTYENFNYERYTQSPHIEQDQGRAGENGGQSSESRKEEENDEFSFYGKLPVPSFTNTSNIAPNPMRSRRREHPSSNSVKERWI